MSNPSPRNLGLRIEWRSPQELVPYHNNPKQHPEVQVNKIASSISEYGFTVPIVVDDKQVVIAGHGRLAAARKLGLTQVPVIQRDDLTPTQAKSLRLADNKSAESPWDLEALQFELKELEELNVPLELTGFDEADLEGLLNTLDEDAQPTEADDEAAAELIEQAEAGEIESRVELGEIWQLGRHRICCGDSTDEATVKQLLGDRAVDMVWADPPYNLGETMSEQFYSGARGAPMGRIFQASWDKGFNIDRFLFCLSSVRPQAGTVYICTTHRLAPNVWSWMNQQNANHYGYCIWAKPNPHPSLSKRHWSWATELICYATFGKHFFNFPSEGHALNWWQISTNNTKALHPTQKPLDVLERAFLHSSDTNAFIFDPFLGSGTSIIAAERMPGSRIVYGIELSPEYCTVILERHERLTGQTAQLVSTLETVSK